MIDSIPLESAATIVSAARVMLRASATTAIRERSEIRGNYNKRGDDVVRRARMGHTEEGSFVIPVLVPIEEVQEPPVPQDPLIAIMRVKPEPFERRVVRTFAQSLHAVREFIVEPAREPTMNRLHVAIERGVSREFCVALSKILAEPSVAQFESRITWATALEGPERIAQVAIESGAQLLLETTAEKLRSANIEPRHIFSGKIVGLRYKEGDDTGDIYVSTMRHGRICEVRVTLDAEQYHAALNWHGEHRAVLIEGEVHTDNKRKLYVAELRRCFPADLERLPLPESEMEDLAHRRADDV